MANGVTGAPPRQMTDDDFFIAVSQQMLRYLGGCDIQTISHRAKVGRVSFDALASGVKNLDETIERIRQLRERLLAPTARADSPFRGRMRRYGLRSMRA
jgi:hypothetical protein